MLPTCTLTNYTQIIVATELDKQNRFYDERIYCIEDAGTRMIQSEAMEFCRDLQAKLPLPVSADELEAFMDYLKVTFGENQLLIGIRDSKLTKLKENWKDIEGKSAIYANLRVKHFVNMIFFNW